MSVLKIKNEDGTWTSITSIRGEEGREGPEGPPGDSWENIKHANTHGSGGTDPIVPKDIGAVSIVANQGLTDDEKSNARENIGAGTGTYSKPSDGIPKSDLASDIQITLSKVDEAASKPSSIAITLLASDWNSETNTQVVTATGVLADEGAQLIILTPSIASQTTYYETSIKCTGQAENSLTFMADTIPTEDLTVYVVIQEVTQG